MKKIKVAVIGAGHLGAQHARIYSTINNVESAGVCDIDKDKASKAANLYNTFAYTNYKSLVGKIDAASICVPTILHYKVARDFLKAGVNLLIEKPITASLPQARDLLRLANKNHLILQVGHVERFNAAVRKVAASRKNPRFIECHRLGPFSRRVTDVGVVLDLMIHDIDIVLGLIKSKVKKIEAIGVKVLTEHEDIANARLTFQNKAVVNLTASRLTPEAVRKIRIFEEDAYISLDYINQSAQIYKKVGSSITQEAIDIQKEEPLKEELEHFIDCVENKKQPLVGGEEAIEALRIALLITKKIHGK